MPTLNGKRLLMNDETITAEATKEIQMTEPVEVKNIFSPGAMPAYGNGGLGGDGMGGLLALSLLGGGLGGRRNEVDNCTVATTALSNAGFDGINHNINTSMIGLTNQLNTAANGITTQMSQGFNNQNNLDLMSKLGTIEGAIPLAEAQVQLAIAGSTASINQNIANGLTAAIVGQAAINKNISDAIATSLASQSAIKETVAAYGVANLTATKDAQFAIVTAVTADGTTTRTLINQLNTDNLNRLLTVSDLDRRDSDNRGRIRESEINITNTNTATAVAVQSQQQQQQQVQLLIQQNALLANLANDIQVVRQGQVIFNSGTMAASGTQAAANTKVA